MSFLWQGVDAAQCPRRPPTLPARNRCLIVGRGTVHCFREDYLSELKRFPTDLLFLFSELVAAGVAIALDWCLRPWSLARHHLIEQLANEA